MPIKAIVCDMDGTLLTADHAISPKTQELLLSLQKKASHWYWQAEEVTCV